MSLVFVPPSLTPEELEAATLSPELAAIAEQCMRDEEENHAAKARNGG